jgi:DNA-binding NarL/FixJ family response regulator
MKRFKTRNTQPVKRITVLLAEDHAWVRKSLKILLELDGSIEVIGEAINGAEAVRLTASLQPQVVVMDIAMPLLTGLQATQQITASAPGTKVLILSAHSDQGYIRQAMAFGASGYLIKQSSLDDLPQAVREVLKGKSYLSGTISDHLRSNCRRTFKKQEAIKINALRMDVSKSRASLPSVRKAPRRSGLL